MYILSHEAGIGVPFAPEFFGAKEQNRPGDNFYTQQARHTKGHLKWNVFWKSAFKKEYLITSETVGFFFFLRNIKFGQK